MSSSFTAFDFLYDSETSLHRQRLDYRLDASPNASQTFTAAVSFESERGVLTDHLSTEAAQRPSRNNTGVTLQYQQTAGPASILTGIRLEHNGSFGFHAAPRASLSWLVPRLHGDEGGLRIHASGGLGIKEPTFLQSFSPAPSFQGNADLKPERSRGVDAGVEQTWLGGRARVDVTWFANHFDDLISLGPSDPVTFASRYENIGETRGSGLELSGEASARGFRLSGSYAWLDSTVVRSISSSPIFAAGRPLYRRPRHSASLESGYSRGRFGVTLGAVFVGSRVDTDFYFPSIDADAAYATWHLGAEARLRAGAYGFVTMENFTNRDYMDPVGYPALGRTLRAGVRARF